MATEQTDAAFALSTAEIDAIGEVLNISMGSAATAISTMLDRQVIITTPKVTVERFDAVNYSMMEPAMIVKIQYVQGISGSNVMVFRQADMQVILNLLMGNDEPPSDEFIFDELSMSAACEVMNQMMGASATALSEFLGKTINISTPTATVLSVENSFKKAVGIGEEETVVSVAFNLDIKGVMNSDFISILQCDLAKTIVNQVMGDYEAAAATAPATTAPPPPPPQAVPPPPPPMAPGMMQPPFPGAGQVPMPGAAPPPQPQQPQQQPQVPPPPPPMAYPPPPGMEGYPPGYPPGMEGYPPGYPPMGGQQPYPQQPYPPYPPYPYPYPSPYPGYPGYPPMPPQPSAENSTIRPAQGIQVSSAQFPNFGTPSPAHVFAAPLTQANLDLMMNVPLSVSVEIGKTKRKIREIMDFGQGTVIELEKQAGAPVDIVVNGQLIARGDVVVIDDNFGVRITEIVGVKDLIESTEPK